MLAKRTLRASSPLGDIVKSTRARGTRERERRRRRESFARPGEQATRSVIRGGSTLLQENIGDVPLDGVTFSRLD